MHREMTIANRPAEFALKNEPIQLLPIERWIGRVFNGVVDAAIWLMYGTSGDDIPHRFTVAFVAACGQCATAVRLQVARLTQSLPLVWLFRMAGRHRSLSWHPSFYRAEAR